MTNNIYENSVVEDMPVKWKIERRVEYREVHYDDEHWRILREKRREALRVMEALARQGLSSIVHGSIARGDVNPKSDIDVFIPFMVPSYRVELALEMAGIKPYKRFIVQATPGHAPKAYIALDEEELRMVSFPLAKLSRNEYEFYKFGGLLDLEGLRRNERVPGVDKRLVLIEPTSYGHRESPVIGRESIVARIIGVSVETVLERVRVLSRRDEIGRTGVFLYYELSPDESFEKALAKLARENQYVRRVLQNRGSLL